MASKIVRMELSEISLVDDPANEEARVVIAKSATAEKVTDRWLADAYAAMAGALVEKAAASHPHDPDAAARAASFLKEHDMDLEQMQKALDDATAALKKAAGDLEARDAEIAKLKCEIAKAKDGADVQGDDELMKSLPEPIRKRLEAAEAEARAATAAFEKMAAEREEVAAVEKAKTLGVGDPKVLGPILVRLEKGRTTAADAAEITRLLKASANQASAGALFRAVGTSETEPADPEAFLKSKADEIRKADPKLTAEQAYAAALERHPEAYGSYIAKRRGAA